MPLKLYMSSSGAGIGGLQGFIDQQQKKNLSAKSLATWAKKLSDKAREVEKLEDQGLKLTHAS